jgi:hypothetical protein
VSHALAHPYGLSLIELEHNMKFQGKPDGLVLEDSAFVGGAH